jgi:hypothetical protein
VFPATGIPNPLYSHPTTFPQRLAATISGYPGYAVGGGRGNRRGLVGGGIAAYPAPVLVGGYGYGGGYDYGYAPPPAPNITIVNAPPAQPSVIINQGYQPELARPVMRDYSPGQSPEPGAVHSYQAPIPSNPEGRRGQMRSVDDDKPTIYLLALHDGTVRSALAYWVEGGTVHYVTTKYVKTTVPVDSIDVTLSGQLNSERGVEFHIPGKH